MSMSQSMKRRVLLKGTLVASAVGVAVGAGLLTPRSVLAAWPKAAFNAESMDPAMNELFGANQAQTSSDISVKAPDIAENGAVVPVEVQTSLSDVRRIAIYAVGNPAPLTSAYELSDQAQGFVATRIKMGKTSDVVAVVDSGGKLYKAAKEVKVTIGGCGG